MINIFIWARDNLLAPLIVGLILLYIDKLMIGLKKLYCKCQKKLLFFVEKRKNIVLFVNVAEN